MIKKHSMFHKEFSYTLDSLFKLIQPTKDKADPNCETTQTETRGGIWQLPASAETLIPLVRTGAQTLDWHYRGAKCKNSPICFTESPSPCLSAQP